MKEKIDVHVSCFSYTYRVGGYKVCIFFSLKILYYYSKQKSPTMMIQGCSGWPEMFLLCVFRIDLIYKSLKMK